MPRRRASGPAHAAWKPAQGRRAVRLGENVVPPPSFRQCAHGRRGALIGAVAGFASIGAGTRVLRASRTPGPAALELVEVQAPVAGRTPAAARARPHDATRAAGTCLRPAAPIRRRRGFRQRRRRHMSGLRVSLCPGIAPHAVATVRRPVRAAPEGDRFAARGGRAAAGEAW